MKMHISREKLRERIRKDPDVNISAGLPIRDPRVIGFFVGETKETTVDELDDETVELKEAFGTLVRQLRRKKGMAQEELADELHVQESELRSIERDATFVPKPRTIYKLAQFFGLPTEKMMQLSGVTTTRDQVFHDVAVKFAANSDDLTKLTRKERTILHEFVKFLSSQ